MSFLGLWVQTEKDRQEVSPASWPLPELRVELPLGSADTAYDSRSPSECPSERWPSCSRLRGEPVSVDEVLRDKPGKRPGAPWAPSPRCAGVSGLVSRSPLSLQGPRPPSCQAGPGSAPPTHCPQSLIRWADHPLGEG